MQEAGAWSQQGDPRATSSADAFPLGGRVLGTGAPEGGAGRNGIPFGAAWGNVKHCSTLLVASVGQLAQDEQGGRGTAHCDPRGVAARPEAIGEGQGGRPRHAEEGQHSHSFSWSPRQIFRAEMPHDFASLEGVISNYCPNSGHGLENQSAPDCTAIRGRTCFRAREQSSGKLQFFKVL